MDGNSAVERFVVADHLISILVRKLGGSAQITQDEMTEAMQSRSTIVGHIDNVSGNFILTLIEPQGGEQ